MTALDIKVLSEWIGRRQRCVDTVTHRLAAALHATLDGANQPTAGTASTVPAAIHWCLAPQIVPLADLGPDGHEQLGGFLPPVPLPRRMWAASELKFHDSIRIGDDVVRESRVADVTAKIGRTGTLCFVTVKHEFTTTRGPAVSERQSIVYRQPAGEVSATQRPVEPRVGRWRREIKVDPVVLFRYSALTFNSHLIHYDRDYCREEGYSDLVVHAPLQASYLLELAASIRGRHPAIYSFRAVAPALGSTRLTLHADEEDTGMHLWITDETGFTTLRAQASW